MVDHGQGQQPTRPGKRSATQQASSSGGEAAAAAKRRAPYAAKACDACRRRKGRCDGRRPCGYCLTRSSECSYSDASDEPIVAPGSDHDAAKSAGDKAAVWTPDMLSNTVRSLGELVAGLQGQLNSLATLPGPPAAAQAPRVSTNSCSPAPPPHHQPDLSRPKSASEPAHDGGPAIHVALEKPAGPGSDPNQSPASLQLSVPGGARNGEGFCGPTSPDYSLNVAQMKLGQSRYTTAGIGWHVSPSTTGGGGSRASEEPSPPPGPSEDGWAALDPAVRQSLRHGLFHFRALLSKRDALRLIRVYDEVIGEMHPLLDTDRLAEQAEGWYNWPAAGSTEPKDGDNNNNNNNNTLSEAQSLLVLNLVLCIALCAEAGCQSESARGLYRSCVSMIGIMLAAPVTGLQHVVLTLLVGLHHYFNDRQRLAWRMCGLAGRMAMEIGLHSRDVYQQFLETEEQQQEAEAISCCLIVLDRQWSAATGLPPNFQLSDFSYADVSMARNPYLKAMMSFTIMSQAFNEPICRVAKGGTYEDDDTFEVTNFQIEQWRRRSLEKHNFTHPGTWQTSPPANLPRWTLVLYLRANAVRTILLRPFFMISSTSTESSRRNSIEPGLDLVSDTINILSCLDRSTDIYRKLHPFLQHFLASSCALLFLIIAYAHQNNRGGGGAASSGAARDAVPADSWDVVARNFKKALALASGYRDSSQESRKLFDRLNMMREPLTKLGILASDGASLALAGEKSTRTPAHHNPQHTSSLTAELAAKRAAAHTPSHALLQQQQLASSMYGTGEQARMEPVAHSGIDGASDGTGLSESQTYVGENTGPFESFLYDWSTNDMNFFFSEGGL